MTTRTQSTQTFSWRETSPAAIFSKDENNIYLAEKNSRFSFALQMTNNKHIKKNKKQSQREG